MEEDVKEETQEKEAQPEAKETVEKTEKKEEIRATSLIDDANTAAERLEKANVKQEELLAKQEQLMAKEALGGRAEAGAQSEKKKPLSDLEYAKEFRKGNIDMEEVFPK